MIPKKPDDVIWSDEQWEAIYDSEKNILVSAGAGSGKTAVLKQRVVEKLINGVSLRNMIILTFTNAAAAEMKERIRNVILEEIDKGNKELIKEYEYVDQANIQTFDSFCLDLVKKYHYVLNMDRNISVIDSALLTVFKRKTIKEIFNKYYEDNDEVFKKLVKHFCIKNTNELEKNIVSISEKLDLLINKDEYLNNYENEFFNEEKLKLFEKDFVEEIKEKIGYIGETLNELKKLSKDNKYLENVEKLKTKYEEFLTAKTFDEIRNAKYVNVKTSTKFDEELIPIFEEAKEKCDKMSKYIDDMINISSIDEQIKKYLEYKDIIMKIIEIIKKLDDAVLSFKHKHNAYEFNDITKIVINLLKKDDYKISKEIKSSMNEIMIDEYQDTSDIQEELISLIARDDNTYMVGDIKQSIYAFRNANSDNFGNKYQEYKKEDNNNRVIELSKNFRSREEVLKNINFMFGEIMNLKFGGVDYNNGHKLIYGNVKFDSLKDHNNDFEIYTYTKDELQNLKEDVAEAIIIAKDIKKKIDSGYLLLDGKTPVKASYKDFCILCSARTHFDTYKKVFESMGIPLQIFKKENFVSSDDVISIINLFRLINDFDKLKKIGYISSDKKIYIDLVNEIKFCLISVLRSFIVGAKNKEINDILLDKNFLETFKNIYPDVYFKIKNLSEIIDKVPLKKFAEEVFTAFDIYNQIIKLTNIDNVENRIMYILEKCEELSNMGYNLSEFIDYFESVKKHDKDIEISKTGDSSKNAVSIMTIHNSKGLEYNVCYFPDLKSTFKLEEFKSMIVFDKEYGIMIPIFIEGMQQFFVKNLFKMKMKEKEIGEKLRLLYVAFTRAIDKFILVCPDFVNKTKEFTYQNMNKILFNSFYDVILSLESRLANRFSFYKTTNIIPKSLPKIDCSVIEDSKDEVEIVDIKIDENILSKEKASNDLSDDEKYIHNKLIDKQTKEKLDFGTEMHKYLECIDYSRYEEEINELFANGFINEYFRNKLISFYKNLNEIMRLGYKYESVEFHHEYEFIYEENDKMLNGIIDLLIELDENMIIIDYKLKNVSIDKYMNQMKAYYDYISLLTDKPIDVYLYSIIDEKFEHVLFK